MSNKWCIFGNYDDGGEDTYYVEAVEQDEGRQEEVEPNPQDEVNQEEVDPNPEIQQEEGELPNLEGLGEEEEDLAEVHAELQREIEEID